MKKWSWLFFHLSLTDISEWLFVREHSDSECSKAVVSLALAVIPVMVEQTKKAARQNPQQQIPSLSTGHPLNCKQCVGVWCTNTTAWTHHRQKGNRQDSWGLPLQRHFHQILQSYFCSRLEAICLTRPSLSSNLFIATQHGKSHQISFFPPLQIPERRLLYIWSLLYGSRRGPGAKLDNNVEKVEDTLHREGVIGGCNGPAEGFWDGKY